MNFSDDFIRADAATLGAPWINELGTYGIDTNRATAKTWAAIPWFPSVVAAFGVVDVGNSDGSCIMRTSVTTNPNSAGPIVRYVDNNNFVGMSPQDGNIFEVHGGISTSLGIPFSSSGGDILTLTVIGAALSAFVNGILVGTATLLYDLTGTKTGIYGYETSSGVPFTPIPPVVDSFKWLDASLTWSVISLVPVSNKEAISLEHTEGILLNARGSVADGLSLQGDSLLVTTGLAFLSIATDVAKAWTCELDYVDIAGGSNTILKLSGTNFGDIREISLPGTPVHVKFTNLSGDSSTMNVSVMIVKVPQ